MVFSKIIRKEKEWQKEYLHSGDDSYEAGQISAHKQSLINLKEYMEKGLIGDENNYNFAIEGKKGIGGNKEALGYLNSIMRVSKNRIKYSKEDIQELNKMIERYG